MVKRSFEELMATEPDVDRARLAAATEEEIRQQAREDGDDPDEEPYGYVLVPHPRDLRSSLDMTQEAFAAFLHIPIGTVRNWEQGRTIPEPAARTLLALVAAEPARALAVLGRPHADAAGALGVAPAARKPDPLTPPSSPAPRSWPAPAKSSSSP